MEPLDPRDRRIAELEAQLAAALGVIDKLTAQVATLTARVHELEARLNQNSSNSSRPPSSDPPGVAAHAWWRRRGGFRAGCVMATRQAAIAQPDFVSIPEFV